jgi:hypothetical protein
MGVNWAAGLMRWQPHMSKEGRAYPLHHLHPVRTLFMLEARGKYPERTLELYFGFSLHTFTRKVMADDDPADNYSDDRETRAFDYCRYQLSFKLPGIARGLGSRTCYFARSAGGLVNYVTIELEDNTRYAAFFNLKKWQERGPNAVLIVFESAYALEMGKSNPGHGSISVKALLGHTIRGTRPKPPP